MAEIKICGITRLEDAIISEKLGAWAIGFIFYPPSPRYIALEKAREISENLKIKKIGVFVNENPEVINKIIDDVGLDYVQLHGNESPEDCNSLNVPFIKTIRNIDETKTYPEAFAFLVDAVDTKNWGGTGKLADWDFAKAVKEHKKPLVLSGGLSASNIKEALQIVRPDFIDLSSSVEAKPGIKNHSALEEFFQVVNSKEIQN